MATPSKLSWLDEVAADYDRGRGSAPERSRRAWRSRSWISAAAASIGAVLCSARHMITAPSTAATTNAPSRMAAFLGQAVLDEEGCERLLPAGEDRGGQAGELGCVVVGLDGHRHDRTAGPETTADEPVAPQHEERIDGVHRIVRLHGGIDQARDEVPRQCHRLADELHPPAGKVVIDRASGSSAVGEHPVDTRGARPVFTQQHSGAEDHLVTAVTPARAHPLPRFPMPMRPAPRELPVSNLWVMA